MKHFFLLAALATLPACLESAAPPAGVDLDVSTLVRLDPADPSVTVAIETDDGVRTIAELARDGAQVYVDPAGLALVDATDDAGDIGASARALAPQCFESWRYPSQQVQGTVMVCYPHPIGGVLCFPYTGWFTITVSCHSRLFCDLAPPNEIRCSYILNGVSHNVAQPSDNACGYVGSKCPDSGGQGGSCEVPPEPC